MIRFFKKYVNIEKGLIGALIMGAIVWYINADHGPWMATVAGLKQGAYTFLFGGIIIRFCENLSQKIEPKLLGILTAAIITSLVAITAVFILHNLKGTPKPLESTIPTIILGPPGFLVIAYLERRTKK